jgi:hypothetical protein
MITSAVCEKENLKYMSPISDANSELEKTPQLIDVDEDEDAPHGFGRLKVGFTPGVDGRSRRVRIFVQFVCLGCYR